MNSLQNMVRPSTPTDVLITWARQDGINNSDDFAEWLVDGTGYFGNEGWEDQPTHELDGAWVQAQHMWNVAHSNNNEEM